MIDPFHKLNLVIADDDTDDQHFMKKAIFEINSNHLITQVYNGAELLKFLLRKEQVPFSTPDCIFLDINMPILNGFDALEKIKAVEELKGIPIYMLTTSSSPIDKEKALSLGASGFYSKSSDYKGLKFIIEEVFSIIAPLHML